MCESVQDLSSSVCQLFLKLLRRNAKLISDVTAVWGHMQLCLHTVPRADVGNVASH
jgi:hypothetical protein